MKNGFQFVFFLLFTVLSLSLLTLAACVKDEPLPVINDPIVTNPTDSTLAKGSFSNGIHAVSGDVKLVKNKDGNLFLAFENFKTDAGPDIRIYLSTDKTASDFTEISPDVNAGTYQIPVPTTAKIGSQKFVLVWCKQFSVLFGSAELK